MPETKNNNIVLEQRRDKYWIKTGVNVIHRDHPERKMIVDEVVKRSSPLLDENGDKKRKTFIVGVDCHWMDSEGKYGNGRFLTMELLPYEEEEIELESKKNVSRVA